MLAFVAVNGHHGVANYKWTKDEKDIEIENSPVMYVVTAGLYECTICTPEMKAKKEFYICCKN